MIRIHRGREPGVLPPIRLAELKRIRPLAAAGALNSSNIGRQYDVVRDRLCRVQHNKCCYCERNNLEPAYLPVEHYRPKLRADRGTGLPDHGYWWLSWTWRNLFFSCQPCNSTFKKNHFPLDAGSKALVPEQRPPGAEIPMLIDPAAEDPIAHIKFSFFSGLSHHRWRPLPRNGSPKGDYSIRNLGLGRPELLDLYERHVQEHLDSIVGRLNAAISAGDAAIIDTIWNNEALGWLSPRRPFVALSYDALDHYIPFAVRRHWSLRLHRPK